MKQRPYHRQGITPTHAVQWFEPGKSSWKPCRWHLALQGSIQAEAQGSLSLDGKRPKDKPFCGIVLSCHKVEHDLLLDLPHQWRASHISHADELEFPLFQDWTGREALTRFRCLAAWSTFRTTYFSETEVKATSRALLPTQNRPGAFRSQWDVSLLLPSFTLPHHSHCRPSCLLSPRFNGSKRLALPLRLAFLGALRVNCNTVVCCWPSINH